VQTSKNDVGRSSAYAQYLTSTFELLRKRAIKAEERIKELLEAAV
jgi:hypothetical protein